MFFLERREAVHQFQTAKILAINRSSFIALHNRFRFVTAFRILKGRSAQIVTAVLAEALRVPS
jgi:hypothetical protein